MVVAHRLLEGLDRRVDGPRAVKDLGGPAPDHHGAIAAVLGLEAANVFPNGFGQIHPAPAGLAIGAVQPLHVGGVEHRRHRFYGLQEVADRVQVTRPVKHAGVDGAVVGVVGDGIPSAEDELVEFG